ncbi:MAG: hypothetical protein K2X27_14310 [Candidatus Obscuribacterales bacterium]|nr:hypothetical protein [Candidatus Obscuribacterales bacterium]
MKAVFPRLAGLVLSLSLAINYFSFPAQACGPDFDAAVLINGIHPDLSLKKFAAGNLGIIQPGWAKSYLIVSYRYLNSMPLDAREQESILHLWQDRLQKMQGFYAPASSDPCLSFFKLRGHVLSKELKKDASRWDFEFADAVSDNAFENARINLQSICKKYGSMSSAAIEWVKAQDQVFGINSARKQAIPAALSSGSAPDLQIQRNYQIAAANFYAGDRGLARSIFEKLAESPASRLRDLAAYMAARIVVTDALDSKSSEDVDKASNYLQAVLKKSSASSFRLDLQDLLQGLGYLQESRTESIEKLLKSVMQPHSERFGNNVGDLSFLMDQCESINADDPKEKEQRSSDKSEISKQDLADWLNCIQQSDQTWWFLSVEDQKKLDSERAENARHSLDRWRKTNSLPWLIAALSTNGLDAKAHPDLFKAAESLPKTSAAYLTAEFYIVDALIKAGRKAEANQRLSRILAMPNLPPSSRNLFKTQNLLVCKSVAEYLRNIVQNPVSISVDIDPTQLPDNWQTLEAKNAYFTLPSCLGSTQIDDLNRNLPQKYWLSFAKDKSISRQLRANLVRSAWLRSVILGEESGLEEELTSLYPSLKKLVDAYRGASGAEKKFALAYLIIKNFGMSPYLDGGVERHAVNLEDFDDYNANFWIPEAAVEDKAKADKSSQEDFYNDRSGVSFFGATRIRQMLKFYSTPQLRSLLSPAELKILQKERDLIYKNPPSKFLGEAIIGWSKIKPDDPRVPEALYKLNRLPKWSALTKQGSGYSHKAYLILHQKYPKSSWTKKAVCWY